MHYSAQKLAATLYKLTQEAKNETHVKDFLKFCHEKKLDYLLPSILRYYKEIVANNEAKNTVHIKAHHKLTDNIISKIKTAVGAEKKTKAVVTEDKNLLGGFVAEYQNKVFNASIKNQLERLENNLINNS